MKVRVSPDGAEQTAIIFDAANGELLIDTSRTASEANGWRPSPMDFWSGVAVENTRVQRAQFCLNSGELLKLRVFLDRSILEVFANGRCCMTQRVYPTRRDSLGIGIFAGVGSVEVHSLNVWDMEAVNAKQ